MLDACLMCCMQCPHSSLYVSVAAYVATAVSLLATGNASATNKRAKKSKSKGRLIRPESDTDMGTSDADEPAVDEDDSDDVDFDGHDAASKASSAGGKSPGRLVDRSTASTSDSDNDQDESKSNAPDRSEDDEDDAAEESAGVEQQTASMGVVSPHAPKIWRGPVAVGNATYGAGGVVPQQSQQFRVKVLMTSVETLSTNASSRVVSKYALLLNLDGIPIPNPDKDEWPDVNTHVLVVRHFGDDAVKHLASLKMGRTYIVDLVWKPLTAGKTLCIKGATKFYQLAQASTVRPFTPSDDSEGDRMAYKISSYSLDAIMHPISSIPLMKIDDPINIVGVIGQVDNLVVKGCQAQKMMIVDHLHIVSCMCFEARSSIKVGVTIAIVNGRQWKNPSTGALEMSITAGTAVSIGSVRVSEEVVDACIEKRFATGRINVSAIPNVGEVRTIRDLQTEAASLKSETATIEGTVQLQLEPGRPSMHGNLTYNSCVTCRRKVKPIDAVDTDGNPMYDHDVEHIASHRANTYATLYYFTGRFFDPSEPTVIHQVQVDDRLGAGIFGRSADALTDENVEAQTDIVNAACGKPRTYNVRVLKNGSITAAVLTN
jgi:hypothetical protein